MVDKITVEDLGSLMKQRGKDVLEKFGEAADSGISDPKLLSILQFVKEYWQDNFRPTLASLCCEAVGADKKTANEVGLMITLTSAGGGIHDDIIDKSFNKHFRMTVLGLYGLDYSLLVGDLLIIKGWAMAHGLAKNSPDKISKVIEVFGEWTVDVCEAEFMEIACVRNIDTDLGQYEKILRQSMADTEACAKLGAIMGQGSSNQIQALAEYASDLGFLFRLSNDLNDVTNIEGNLKVRLENESVPLPILYAAKFSQENYVKTKEILSQKIIDPQDLMKLLDLCLYSNSFGYVLELAKRNKEHANKKLLELDDSYARAVLSLILENSFMDISRAVE